MSWLGLNTSVTGMFTSQRKLYTVNHNVANAEREGYSRQRVKSSATVPLHISGKGYIGTGIGVNSVERVRDLYVDKKYRTETASLGNWNVKNSALSEIEGVLRGGKEEGININIDQLFASIEDLSTNPTDMSYRTSFREKAVTLTKTLNETVKRLYKQQKDLNFEIKTKIKQVNDYADQISSLNSEIFAMEVDGSNANDLRDQRDLIVDKLSKLVDIEAEERVINVEDSKDGKTVEIKKFEVRIGGMSLVDHSYTSKLKYPPDRMPNTLNPEESLYKLEWESGGDVKLKGGEIKGLLEVRDGGYAKGPAPGGDEEPGTGGLVNASYEYNESNGIPYYIKRLDEFAQVFAEKMNDIHIKGQNLMKPPEKTDGIFLFTKNGEKSADVEGDPDLYKKIRADNISISGDIIADLNNIATIDKSLGVDDKENNGILKEMLEAREKTDFFSGPDVAYQGKPEDYLTSILSTLGTDNQQAQRMEKVQSLIVKGAINQRLSISGVNLDEEMADMVKFQQIFNASARMVSTFDQMYDTMINRLGMVGR